jgi:hypothetical protein
MGEWITDPKKLPEEGKRVLVYFLHIVYGAEGKTYMKPAIDTGRWKYGVWELDGWLRPEVKAWMPLPEMPVIKEE